MSSIRARLMIGGLMVIVLPLLLFSYISVRLLWQFYLQELETQLRAHANLIAQSSAAILAPETPDDPKTLIALVERWQSTTNIRLTLCDRDGIVQAAPEADAIGQHVDEQKQPGMLEALEGRANTTVWKSPNFGYEDTMYVNLPVRLGSRIVGAVRVAYTLSQIHQKVSSIQTALTTTLAGYALILLLLTGLLGAAIVRPVEKLNDDARELARGNLEHAVDAGGFREVRSLALTLEHMRLQLRNLERLRRRRVSDVSHEIRTPLASIRAMAETVMAHGADDPGIREKFLRRIVEQTDRLADFASQLLDLEQIESGKTRLALQPVDVTQVLQTAVFTVEGQATKKGVAIRYNPAVEAPPVLADKERLVQIFVNLIDNAVRHTPAQGTVTVDSRPEETSMLVAVEDNGCGIPAKHLPHIFDRFYRVDKNRTPGTGGAGLGLCIVRETVSAHGGQVTVESEEHRGTRFVVRIPLAVSDAVPEETVK